MFPVSGAEQFVASGSGENHFHEFAGEAGDVVVRVGLADPGFLDVIDEILHAALHVTCLQDHNIIVAFDLKAGTSLHYQNKLISILIVPKTIR